MVCAPEKRQKNPPLRAYNYCCQPHRRQVQQGSVPPKQEGLSRRITDQTGQEVSSQTGPSPRLTSDVHQLAANSINTTLKRDVGTTKKNIDYAPSHSLPPAHYMLPYESTSKQTHFMSGSRGKKGRQISWGSTLGSMRTSVANCVDSAWHTSPCKHEGAWSTGTTLQKPCHEGFYTPPDQQRPSPLLPNLPAPVTLLIRRWKVRYDPSLMKEV